jgi:hypothetical protein
MPNDHDIQKTLELLLQLRSLFETRAGGSEDLASLRRVRELGTMATREVPDVYCRIRLGELENYADALFSDRKHQRWARRSASGVLSLRHKSYATLDALERRLHLILAARQRAVGKAVLERAAEDPGP